MLICIDSRTRILPVYVWPAVDRWHVQGTVLRIHAVGAFPAMSPAATRAHKYCVEFIAATGQDRPCTLHPTPCTLHPTPYIPHPTAQNGCADQQSDGRLREERLLNHPFRPSLRLNPQNHRLSLRYCLQ